MGNKNNKFKNTYIHCEPITKIIILYYSEADRLRLINKSWNKIVKENIHPAPWFINFDYGFSNLSTDKLEKLLIILSYGWTQVNLKKILDNNILKLMFILKLNTIIYFIENFPEFTELLIKKLEGSSKTISSTYNINLLQLMIICKPDIIIYLIAKFPNIMVDLIKNGGHQEIFKLAKTKTINRQVPEIYIKKLYLIPEVFP